MKKYRKLLTTALCAAALVGASILGTMAYFTDNEAVVNTFTVGNVDITLDEAKVSTDGEVITGTDADRVQANGYHLIPGHVYTKDPTVHITANSEDCYVFVTVDNQIADIEWNDDDTYKTIAKQMVENNQWSVLKDSNTDVTYNNLLVYVHAGNGDQNNTDYKANVIVESDKTTDLKVFDSFRIDGENVIARHDETGNAPTGFFYIDDYETVGEAGKAITVNAYAVQADGFDTALAAWQASYGKTF